MFQGNDVWKYNNADYVLLLLYCYMSLKSYSFSYTTFILCFKEICYS